MPSFKTLWLDSLFGASFSEAPAFFFLPRCAVELLYFALLPAERSDFMGGPRGAAPPS